MKFYYDQNGERLSKDIRRENDGTWSRNVWTGGPIVTDIRRYTGYATRAAAREGDISESAAETNQRMKRSKMA